MKIIKPGNTEPKTISFSCSRCGCVFEAVRDLEARRVHDQRDGDYYECACPTCNKNCTRHP